MPGNRNAGVGRYLARLRWRAAWLHGLRALIAGSGAASCVFALGAVALGPLGGVAWTLAAWLLVVAAAAAVGVWAWRRFAPLSGGGVARLLSSVAPELGSAARTAYELERDPPAQASGAMILAHAAHVQRELRYLPPSRVIRWRALRHRAIVLGLAGLAFGALLLATDRGRSGAYAMFHPGERDAEGERVAVAFSGVRARLTYPSYLAREPVEVLDPGALEVPRGTSIELRAVARIEALDAALRVGDATIPMELDDEGRWYARFVARADTPVVLRLERTRGDWVRDATPRSVRALPDEAPSVRLLAPTEDIEITELSELTLSWEATDDVALNTVDLVIRGVDGEEHRRRIGSYPEGPGRPMSANGDAVLDLALQAMNRGDTISAWIEARDADVVSGPNAGRSRELSVTLASEATRREQRLAGLRALLDSGLNALADRLERPVPEAGEEAGARFDALELPTQSFIRATREQTQYLREEGGARESDVALLRSMSSRVRRLLEEERVAHGRRTAAFEPRRRIDVRFGTELEDDVITLDDLLRRARVEDAAEIARELEEIRREIHSLLAELVRTDSPEARSRLLAAIARAQARMRDLLERLSQMGTDVPREFSNPQEMPTQEASDALENLREAVESGDMERAERLMRDLRSMIDQIAASLGQTEQQFGESRFGPRDRAMANATEALGQLEQEQQRLATRGTERRSGAARRALESIGGRDNRIGHRLAGDARLVREQLERVDRDHLASFEQDGYDRAVERLIDAEDAFEAGDLGEARVMTEAAQRDISTLSRDLDLSALMFPGHEGETASEAGLTREADRSLSALRRQLDEALPDIASHLDQGDRAQMRADLELQRDATRAAESLEQQFARGPDGAPLSEDTARVLREAGEVMQAAQRELGVGDPISSARLQEHAARLLAEERERLEEQQQNQGGGGGGQGSSSRSDSDRPVDIPEADEFEGPMELRRRLLDAMREGAPAGYEDAVRRYYEGLLR